MINIGTSGFSYDDWKGYFYPTNIAKKDMSAYYSRHFANVEINSTYYNIPSVATFRSLVNKTPDEFKFCVKAHRDMTHSESHSPDTFHRFRESLSPLIDSGKLGCVLGQFPWSFKRTAQNRNRLRNFKNAIGTLPTVLEFRNSEWVQDETFELLRELGF